jgi:hypothetical protein
LLAGREAVIHVERDGFDPFDYPVQVEANEVRPIKLLLTPNARTVVLTTEPDGVEVFLDGVAVGTTARPMTSSVVTLPAELVLQNLPLGEHVFELRKECYRTEVIEEILNVDLLDRSPRRFNPVIMLAARSTLLLEEGPEGARVEADGRPLGSLPLEPSELCPGDRELLVEFGGRILWKSVEFMESGQEVRVRVQPRPNVVLVGADEWPDALAEFAERFNDTGRVRVPPATDLSQVVGWKGVDLPDGTDLALAVIPSERVGARDRWVLYSPILQMVEELDVAPEGGRRPEWERRVWGLRTVDSEVGGSGRVAWVREGGPGQVVGLNVGDRIVRVGDAEPTTSTPLRELLSDATDELGRARIAWIPSSGERQEGTLEAGVSPFLRAGPTAVGEAAMRAAWAVVDAVRSSDRAASALANLALLFSEFGYHDLAVQTWRRVRWEDRGGIGEGTADYYLGAELARLGLEEEAIAAYRRAAASSSTVVDDDGPQVAPAAIDRLVDLGVTLSDASTAR